MSAANYILKLTNKKPSGKDKDLVELDDVKKALFSDILTND